MISSVLMVVIFGIIVLGLGIFLFSSVIEAVKYNDKEWFMVALVFGIWYSVLVNYYYAYS